MKTDIERFINWVHIRSPQAKTWRDYQCDLNLFLRIVGERKVGEIRARDVDKFVNFQINQGYKPSTVNRRLAAVASFYEFLNSENKQVVSPVIPRRHHLPEPQRLPRPVEKDDLKIFFSAINDARDRAMFTLMLRCGLRIGEISGLKLSNLFLGEHPARMIILGKGSRERIVLLSMEAEQALTAWLDQRLHVSCEYVFISYQNRRISTTSISIHMKHIQERCGLTFTAHQLRHTFADQLLSAGMPITSIQKLLGHRFIETTQNYAMANDKQVQADFYQACNKLEGWSLLKQAGQSMGQNKKLDGIIENGEIEKNIPIQFEIPKCASLLPLELLSQLEALRHLKVIRWRAERIIPNSHHYYNRHTLMWKFFIEQRDVKGVTCLRLEHVLDYVKNRLEAGSSTSTVNNDLSALRSFLSFLKDDEVDVHPSLEAIKRLKQTERLPRYMSAEQVLRLCQQIEMEVMQARQWANKHDARLLQAIFYLLWQGGLRLGEVEGLKFKDFYISTSSDCRRLFVRDGKWRKGRVIYLTDVMFDALRRYLSLRGQKTVGGYVFIRNGAPLKKGYICKQLKRAGNCVDVYVVPHRLRHTFATQLLNAGCRATSIQKLLGHKSLNTTMIYARALDHTVMADYLDAMNIIEAGT